jgi:hypothetical protein
MKLVWIAVILILISAAAVVYAVWRQRNQRSGEPYHLVKTMEQRTDGSWSEPVLHADTSAFIGKHLVIAVRYPQAGKCQRALQNQPRMGASKPARVLGDKLSNLNAFLTLNRCRLLSGLFGRESCGPSSFRRFSVGA